MGARGPVRKSNKLRTIEGNAGKVPMKQEIKPPPIVPERPSWVTGDARREWEFIVPHLEKLGLLTILDGAALAIYCTSYARWREAERQVDKEGTTITGPRGGIQKHPAVTVAQQYYKQVKEMLAEFGLTPQARARMSVVSEESDHDQDFFGF